MRLLKIFVLGWLFISANPLVALSSNAPSNDNKIEIDTLPKVFLLGEHEVAFEQLTLAHSTMLLEACNDDMKIAYHKWYGMIKEMEAHSELVNYDLKGLKLWLNIFWDPDGRVSHIAYYLKPQSKFVDINKLSLFLNDFLKSYSFPFEYSEKFSHYGSVSFPTMPTRISNEKKKNNELANDNKH